MPEEIKPGENVDDVFERVKAFGRKGEFFQQADFARVAVNHFPEDWRLKHMHVLSIANAGGLAHAMELYENHKLQEVRSVDALTLRGRLLKDRALSHTSDNATKSHLLREAAAAYEQAIEVPGIENAYYPEDNAAQLYLLAGENQRAVHHAENVLNYLGSLSPGNGEEKWQLASRVNALVICGRFDEAVLLADELISAFSDDWAGAATTVEHLIRLADHMAMDSTWLDGLRPPSIIMFSGHIISATGEPGRFVSDAEPEVTGKIRHHLSKKKIGHGYGSLAAGSDIIFAETLLSLQKDITIVLPCDEEDFIQRSVAPSGIGWVRRYNAVKANRHTQIVAATDEPLLNDDGLFGYCARICMGLTVLRADYLKTDAEQIALWDGGEARGAAGTAIDVALWHRKMSPKLRRRQTIIPVEGEEAAVPDVNLLEARKRFRRKDKENRRVARACLFGDFAGFSKLQDSQIPGFVTHVLGGAADVLQQHPDDILFRNTWGDGLFVVTKRSREAAVLAIKMQEAMAALPYALFGLPQSLKFRIGGHLGPVFEQQDPVLQEMNFFGSQVSHAARIEPVAPPGATYVSGYFAAALAFDHPDEFQCDLVGTTNLAKKYGATRIFSLRGK